MQMTIWASWQTLELWSCFYKPWKSTYRCLCVCVCVCVCVCACVRALVFRVPGANRYTIVIIELPHVKSESENPILCGRLTAFQAACEKSPREGHNHFWHAKNVYQVSLNTQLPSNRLLVLPISHTHTHTHTQDAGVVKFGSAALTSLSEAHGNLLSLLQIYQFVPSESITYTWVISKPHLVTYPHATCRAFCAQT